MIERYLPAYTEEHKNEMMKALNKAIGLLATMKDAYKKTQSRIFSEDDESLISSVYYASKILRCLHWYARRGKDPLSTLVDDLFQADNGAIVRCINLLHYQPLRDEELVQGTAYFSLKRFVYHVEKGWITPQDDDTLNEYVKQGKISSPYTDAQFMSLLEETLPELGYKRLMYGSLGTFINMDIKTLTKRESKLTAETKRESKLTADTEEKKGENKSERLIAVCQIIVDAVKPPSKFSKLPSKLSKLFVDETAAEEYKIAQHVAAELFELSQHGDFQRSFANVFTHIKEGNSNFAGRVKTALLANFPKEYSAAEKQQSELAKKPASSPERKV